MTLIDRNADYITKLAGMYQVEARAIRAVLRVEAGGEGLCEERPIIRLEVHHLWLGVEPRRRRDVDALFVVRGPRPWEGHEWRPDVSEVWRHMHMPGAVGQRNEWEALEAARKVDDRVAIESTSWGCAQVLGRHWRVLGLVSPAALVHEHYTERGQLTIMMRFIEHVAGATADLRDRRWSEFARRYNGASNVSFYAGRLESAYELEA